MSCCAEAENGVVHIGLDHDEDDCVYFAKYPGEPEEPKRKCTAAG